MKKTFYTLLGIAIASMPNMVFAQYGLEPTVQPTNLPITNDFGSLLTYIINWFLSLVGLIAVLMLIFGGFRYLVSGGNDESTTKAKNTIMYAIIGIVVVILSYAIVSTITWALGSF